MLSPTTLNDDLRGHLLHLGILRLGENINFTSMLSGDVNADGILNILDVVLLVGEVLNPGDFTDSQLASGDLNNDGLLNILDVVMLVNIILN